MRRWWWVLLVLVLLAPGRKVQAEGAGFTVTPKLPSNQIGGNTGWFNLLVKPGVKQNLTVEVDNQSAEAKKLELSLTNAFTQDNGQVGYEPNKKQDASAKVQLTAIGSKPITITLAARQGRNVTFQVTPPAKSFPGQVLGAIYVRDLTKPAQASGSGFAVTNQFAMVVAVQLQTSQKLVPPELHLLAVKPKADNVSATIQNAQPRLFGKLKLTARIYPAGATKAVATQRSTNYAMAPNSAFNYQVTPKTALAAGKYRLVIDASAGSYKWHLTRNFTLSAPVVPSQTAAAKKSSPAPWWPWVIALVAMLLLGILLGWWRGRKTQRG